MNEIKAVVVHWDGGIVKSIRALKLWMESATDHWYHRFIKGSEIDYGRSTAKKATHCGAPVYTPEAVKYFGKYCTDWEHKVKKHNNSPNNCTIGICILHNYDDGGYSDRTMEAAGKICGELLSYYKLGIEGLWTHSMICGEDYKHCPKEFVEKPEQWEKFKNIVKKYL